MISCVRFFRVPVFVCDSIFNFVFWYDSIPVSLTEIYCIFLLRHPRRKLTHGEMDSVVLPRNRANANVSSLIFPVFLQVKQPPSSVFASSKTRLCVGSILYPLSVALLSESEATPRDTSPVHAPPAPGGPRFRCKPDPSGPCGRGRQSRVPFRPGRCRPAVTL